MFVFASILGALKNIYMELFSNVFKSQNASVNTSMCIHRYWDWSCSIPLNIDKNTCCFCMLLNCTAFALLWVCCMWAESNPKPLELSGVHNWRRLCVFERRKVLFRAERVMYSYPLDCWLILQTPILCWSISALHWPLQWAKNFPFANMLSLSLTTALLIYCAYSHHFDTL